MRNRSLALHLILAGLPQPSPNNPAIPKTYTPWKNAGGPNECPHGYAEGIPCPRCDAADEEARNANDPMNFQ